MSTAAKQAPPDVDEPQVDESGVDLAQIRAMLALTPAKRLERATAFLSSLLAGRTGDGNSGPA